MSMRNYSVTGYGIILNGMMPEDDLDELSEEDSIDYQYAFTGEAFPLKNDGNEDWGAADTFDDETLYFVALPKYPQFLKAAYKDMKELTRDMAKAYRSVKGLPKLSMADIRKRIRSFQGTYYG